MAKKAPKNKIKIIFTDTIYFLGLLPIGSNTTTTYYKNMKSAMHVFRLLKRDGDKAKLLKFSNSKWHLISST